MNNYCKLYGPDPIYEIVEMNMPVNDIIGYTYLDDSTVLDYGCGPAGTIQAKNIEGFDIDVNNTYAKYHDRNEIIKVYDYIIIKYVIEHMCLEEVIEFLQWAKNHCKTLIICIPNPENPWIPFWIDLTHKYPYYAQPLAKLISLYGYKIIRLTYCNIEPGLRRRLFDYLFGVNPYQDAVIVVRNTKFEA